MMIGECVAITYCLPPLQQGFTDRANERELIAGRQRSFRFVYEIQSVELKAVALKKREKRLAMR